MRWKRTRDLTQTRRNIAMIAMVIVSSTMLVGCQSDVSQETEAWRMQAMETKFLQAQGPGTMNLEVMPEQLEAVVKETVDAEINAVITLGPVEHEGPSKHERTFLTKEWFGNPVIRTVNLEEYPIKLEVMPGPLEAVVKETVDPEVNAIITLGPNGQERTFLTRERFDPDDPDTVTLQEFPIKSPKQINRVISTRSGVVYLSWEASPDHQCQNFPGVGCLPVQHSH